MNRRSARWSGVRSFADVTAVGKNYLLKKVNDSPWSGPSANLYSETTAPATLKPLLDLHEYGVVTMDSQSGRPAANEGVIQKSYVQGLVDRRYAPALARELQEVPGTIVFVYDYKTHTKMGNFKPATAENRNKKTPLKDYYIVTKEIAAPHRPLTVSVFVYPELVRDVLEVIEEMPTLHAVVQSQSAFFYVYNSEYGARPEASEKVLAVMKRLMSRGSPSPSSSLVIDFMHRFRRPK